MIPCAITLTQLAAIAGRVGMGVAELGGWFERRRVLGDWVAQQPQMTSSRLRSMFYRDNNHKDRSNHATICQP